VAARNSLSVEARGDGAMHKPYSVRRLRIADGRTDLMRGARLLEDELGEGGQLHASFWSGKAIPGASLKMIFAGNFKRCVPPKHLRHVRIIGASAVIKDRTLPMRLIDFHFSNNKFSLSLSLRPRPAFCVGRASNGRAKPRFEIAVMSADWLCWGSAWHLA
jgi:hypothetical protein